MANSPSLAQGAKGGARQQPLNVLALDLGHVAPSSGIAKTRGDGAGCFGLGNEAYRLDRGVGSPARANLQQDETAIIFCRLHYELEAAKELRGQAYSAVGSCGQEGNAACDGREMERHSQAKQAEWEAQQRYDAYYEAHFMARPYAERDVFWQWCLGLGAPPAETGPLAVTASPTWEATPTPAPDLSIVLQASAEGYGEATQVIENGANAATVTITGRITDAITGAGIGSAGVSIIAGALSGSTLSAADGSYTITTSVPGGNDSGQVSGVDFALAPQADLTIEVKVARDELLADGLSTTDILVSVKDALGNPLNDREISLSASAEDGPGSIQPTNGITDTNGLLQATYTAFKPAPELGLDNQRIEVMINARDAVSGGNGSGVIYVSQYQLTVIHDAYIPACRQCAFPAKLDISVTDVWAQPIPDTPLALEVVGLASDATLVGDPSDQTSQQQLEVITDSSGQATVHLKWQGDVAMTEAVRQIAILDRVTHARATRDVQVHGLDVAITRVQEAGFTGVTGQEAFFKVYVKERAHPDLALDRFNASAPNRLKLHVAISQLHAEGANTSYSYESNGGWERDELGAFVTMYTTPRLPHIIPVNDGTSWYEIRVDAVDDNGVYLPDLDRGNNDAIVALTTGSPEGWLHTWLADGVLTPHSYPGALIKCVARFLPGVGDAMTVIDTLNQVYNTDVLGLGQSTSQVLSEALQQKATTPSMLTQLKASALNNVVSCMQDVHGVSRGASPGPDLHAYGVCFGSAFLSTASNRALAAPRGDAGPAGESQSDLSAGLVSARSSPPLSPLVAVPIAEDLEHDLDQFIHGFLLDSPDQLAVVVVGLPASDVTMLNAHDERIDGSIAMSTSANTAIYILPPHAQHTLHITTASAVEIAVYQPGSSDDNRQTYRLVWQPDALGAATMLIGGGSDYGLAIDEDGDQTLDQLLPAKVVSHDVARPSITSVTPAPGATLSTRSVAIAADYADNSGGSGIDAAGVRLLLDGQDQTALATVDGSGLTFQAGELATGEHTVRVEVADLEGNRTSTEWRFHLGGGYMGLLASPLLLPVAGGGVGLLLLMIVVVVLAHRRHDLLGQKAAAANAVGPDVWWLARGEERFGPYSWAQLVAAGHDGRIGPNDLIYDPRTRDWRLASGYPGLRGGG